jgi:hypothetical protein
MRLMSFFVLLTQVAWASPELEFRQRSGTGVETQTLCRRNRVVCRYTAESRREGEERWRLHRESISCFGERGRCPAFQACLEAPMITISDIMDETSGGQCAGGARPRAGARQE